jgi:hypothetical protein
MYEKLRKAKKKEKNWLKERIYFQESVSYIALLQMCFQRYCRKFYTVCCILDFFNKAIVGRFLFGFLSQILITSDLQTAALPTPRLQK